MGSAAHVGDSPTLGTGPCFFLATIFRRRVPTLGLFVAFEIGFGDSLPRHPIVIGHLNLPSKVERKISLEYIYILLLRQCGFLQGLYF